MSEFDEQVEKGGGMTDTAEMSNSTETYDEIISRHKSECRELEGKVRAMLKKAKKSNKAEVEAQTIQMDFDLKQKHRDEIEEFEEKHGESIRIAKCFLFVKLLKYF